MENKETVLPNKQQWHPLYNFVFGGNRLMRKIVCVIFVILSILFIAGCSSERNPNYVPPEQPHLYWKDIDVEVTKIDKRQWFATVHRRI